ncbi:LysR substrate-binding domain-containing protein [Salinisphaera sp.]|uniref:LysR substrate-binding domain-containing protein n=1 Tax=Salinisphaera sp. TaxID=1914330 RepID=UPI000C5466CB|nr:LysR substrate-binding domain-containing protein [Salinisphaera sp.]MBS61789.1 LysR family transcriptional regulator [Salinisphaera sp.]
MQTRLPNLNFLITFEVAGQQLSFKRAAEALCVTPSAVSQQIQQLEDFVGKPLFVRHNRSLVLTDDGEQYLTQIQPHLNGLRKATNALRKEQTTKLRVSVMPPVANRILLPNLEEFQRIHQHVELQIDTALTNSNLLSENIDLAVRFGQPPWPGLTHEKLCEVKIQPIMPVGYSQKYDLPSNVSSLTELPLIHMAERPGAWNRVFNQLGLPASSGPAYHVDDYPAAVQAAESLGAALALFPIEQPLIKSGRVEAPFPPIGPLDEAIYAVYPTNREMPTAGRIFIDWLGSLLAIAEL